MGRYGEGVREGAGRGTMKRKSKKREGVVGDFYFISQTDRAQRHKDGEHKTRVLKGNQIVSEIIFWRVIIKFDEAKKKIFLNSYKYEYVGTESAFILVLTDDLQMFGDIIISLKICFLDFSLFFFIKRCKIKKWDQTKCFAT